VIELFLNMLDTKDKDLDSVAKLVLGQYALSDAIYFSLLDSQSLFTDPFQFLSGDINELGLKKGPISFSTFSYQDLGGNDPVGAFANKRCLAMTKALRQNQKDHFEFELTFFAGKTYLLYSCLLGYVQDRKTFVIALKRLRILESFVTGLVQKASIDTTTGLENKDVCLREINALPLDDKSFVIFMDLNNFKLVNDVYGHTVGDIILKRFSDVLKKDRFKSFDPYRFGGDEFVVIARNCTEAFVRRYLDEVQTHFALAVSEKTGMSFSAGVIKASWTLTSPLFLITLSDRAMYLAKKKGCSYYILTDQETKDFIAHPLAESPF